MNTGKTSYADIVKVKEEGNNAFKNENYYKAILFYEEGVRRCQEFGIRFQGQMPYRMQIGEDPKVPAGSIFYQDFCRVKSMLRNNIAVCYFNLNKMRECEKFNDMALMEDPDYGKALLRKCLILEKKGEFTQGHDISRFAISRFDDDFEDDNNRKLVPQFKEINQRLKPLIGTEKQRKAA